MNLPNIWELCLFSDEIVYGIFDKSKFAVELHSVLDGSADPIYKDPERFLAKTHLTHSMRSILKGVLSKIAKDEGNPVYVIDTEFGGGKTHTLLLLYHIFKNRELGTKYIREYGIDREYGILEVPETRVIAIDCNNVRKNTLWGEIADSIGRYERFKGLDEEKRAPNITSLKELFNEPTLLLIDELPEYLLKADSIKVGNISLAELTIAFIQDLVRAVASTKNCMLIITLTATQKLYEAYSRKVKDGLKTLSDFRVDNIISDTKESLSRQAQFIVPVSKEEVYDVIVKRLVKDRRGYEKVINTYYEYYKDKGLIEEVDYKDKLSRSYPFHPFLIDTLYDRVSSIDKFNKTRGMLRLLALVLYNIYKNKVECKLVSTGDIDLSELLIKEDLTDGIDMSEFKPVIESDCISKARRLDKDKSIKLVEKIARTIYIYSLISSTKVSGIKPSELKLAVCYPYIDTSLVDEILEEIEKDFWYIKRTDNQYYFTKKPNINKIIEDYMKEVREEEIRKKIRDTLEELVRDSRFKVCIWDQNCLQDDESFKLFVIDYEYISDNEENNKRLFNDIIEKDNSSNIRIYQNTIVLLSPESYKREYLKLAAKRVIATEEAMKDERVKLDEDEVKKAKKRKEEFEAELKKECMNTYSKVVYPYSSDIRIDTLSFLETKRYNLTDAIIELLKKKGKLVESIKPEVLEERIDRDPVRIKEIYKVFLRDRREKFVMPQGKILDAIKEGIEKGLFGYTDELEEVEDGKYKAVIGRYTGISMDGWLIKKDLVYRYEHKYEDVKSESVSLREPISIPTTTEPISIPKSKPGFRYKFRSNNINEAIKVLPIINIVGIEGGMLEKHFFAELKDDNENKITIDSKLKNVDEIKSLLNQLKVRYNGSFSIEIMADRDISDELNKYEMKYERD